ncbi:site-specific DNA-methyltransferase [uncultured Hymenobacter sp.]|uniref:site-specific DNA-methyltransferase n=1 Tax=uncultured Hymenobacter sp. TaxID=170016 RepID=UPI0035CBE09F
MDGHSLTPTPENIARLGQLFPEVISEGRIDFERLRAALEAADALPPASSEHYELRWAGKAEARREVQRPTTATLVPDPAQSVAWDTTANVFIEGENLEVLRVLQRGYFGKVKMIYIDPPYNTGSDSFVYPDDYSERREEYEKRTGQRDENGFLNKQDLWKKNTRENGQYHSAWLSMMWPRLYLSRNLLREDGVIFVSIDDNEVHNLRLVLNEIFGEENFIGTIIWKKKTNGNNVGDIPPVHDYILCFAKQKVDKQDALLGFPMTDEYLRKTYKNPDKDPRGPWTTSDLSANHEGPYFPILNAQTGVEYYPPEGRYWVFNEAEAKVRIADGRIIFGRKGLTAPVQKSFLKDRRSTRLKADSWWSEHGLNEDGTAELAGLLGPKAFVHSKPSDLIKHLLNITTVDGDLILDFFAGSGTTGQAVYRLNEEDKAHRKFILVQLGEPVEDQKIPFRTIADITRARLTKAGEKLRAARAGQLPLAAPTPPDTGFRVYRLDYSNFRAWRPDVQLAPDMLAQLELFQEPLRRDGGQGEAADAALLTELLLKMAGGADVLPLSVAVARREVAGVAVHDVAGGLVWLALAGINPAVVAAAVAARPQRLVVPGRLFTGDNPDEQVSNARLQLAGAGVALQLI